MATPQALLTTYYGLGDLTDSKGSHTLTNAGSVTFGPGLVGDCADFNGSSKYLTAADATDLQVGGNQSFFLSFLIRMRSAVGTQSIASKKTTSNASTEWWAIRDASNRLGFYLWNGTAFVNVLSAAVSTGAWHRVLMWFDSAAATINVQVNGGAVNSTAWTGTTITGSSLLCFGRQAYNGASQYFDGELDEFCFGKGLLSADQRAYIGAGGLTYAQWNVILGSTAATFAGMTSSAAGAVSLTGSTAVLFAGMTSAAAGVVSLSGAAAATFAGMTSSGAGTVSLSGAGGLVFDGMTSGAAGVLPIVAGASISFDGMAGSGSGQLPIVGAGAGAFAGMTAAAVGELLNQAAGGLAFDGMTSSATATIETLGRGAIGFAGMTSSAQGTVSLSGAGGLAFDGMTSGAAGVVSISGAATLAFSGMSVIATQSSRRPTAGADGAIRRRSVEGLLRFRFISETPRRRSVEF